MDNQPTEKPLESFPKKKTGRWMIMVGVLVLLLIAGGAFAYYLYHQKIPVSQPTDNSNNPVVVVTDPNGNQLQPGGPGYPTTTPDSNQPGDNSVINSLDSLRCQNTLPTVASRSGMVQWQSPKKIKGLRIFKKFDDNSDYIQDDSYVVGKVLSGKYQGGDMILTIVSYEGMGVSEDYDHIVNLNGKYYYLARYSADTANQNGDITPAFDNYSVDRDFSLSDLDFPNSLQSNNPSANFSLVSQFGFYRGNQQQFCADNMIKAFTDPVLGDVYTDTQPLKTLTSLGNSYQVSTTEGFYAKAPDGTSRTYSLNIPIQPASNVTAVTWSNGKANSNEYSYQHPGGCGPSQLRDVVDVALSDLVPVGTSRDGQTVYGYANTKIQDLQDMYNNIYVPDGETKITYGAFLADHPIFFWQDPFGKFIRFKTTKYQPLAECGKPVIYLYPTQTEKVAVNLAPVGGFTYTEPVYNNGWQVIADPLGNLTNISDGKQYPYLFWEGRGGIYQTPSKGFVVAQSGVHELLENKLALAGLNSKEKSDFESFWEPKMQDAPYYFVTFMGNNVMDQIAPLTVTPKPDTVIRVLMDFKPLQAPISVEGINIHTPERKGFTVVEWGGVLR